MSLARCRSSTTWIWTEDSQRRRSSSWSPGVFAKYQQIASTNVSEPIPIIVEPMIVNCEPPNTYVSRNADVPANIAIPATANLTGDRVGWDAVSAVVDVQGGSADLLSAEPEIGKPLPRAKADDVE